MKVYGRYGTDHNGRGLFRGLVTPGAARPRGPVTIYSAPVWWRGQLAGAADLSP